MSFWFGTSPTSFGAGTDGRWWTSSKNNPTGGVSSSGSWYRGLSSSNAKVTRGNAGLTTLYSVRCILGDKGCTDQNACNYDSFPTTESDNSLCIYPVENCEVCSGETDGSGTVLLADDDLDGICDDDEVSGCTYEWGATITPLPPRTMGLAMLRVHLNWWVVESPSIIKGTTTRRLKLGTNVGLRKISGVRPTQMERTFQRIASRFTGRAAYISHII